jgi:ribosomal protein S6
MDKKVYEISFLLSGKLIDTEIADVLQKIKKSFEEVGATVLKEFEFNKINLAYPIKKENAAYFGYFWFELDPQKIAELRKKFAFEKEILRYLLITPPPKYQTKSDSSQLSKKRYNNKKVQNFSSDENSEETFNKYSPNKDSTIREESADEKLEEKLEEIQKLA